MFVRRLWDFHLAMLYKLICGARVSAPTKKSEKFLADPLVLHPAGGFPMRVSDSSVGGEAAQFHTTRWTLVMASARDQSQTGRGALPPSVRSIGIHLYAFARRRGHSPHDAQDLTQGFFLHLLEHRALSGVDRLKGKFRSFLLACFQNYLSAETHRAQQTQARGPVPVCFPRPGNC